MSNNNTGSREAAFVKNVALRSGIVALLLLAAGICCFIRADELRGYAVGLLARNDRYTSAVELAEKITEPEKQKAACYSIAACMYEDGEYADAADMFLELGDHADSEEMYLKSRYALADGLYGEGMYDEALDIFSQLGSYSDCSLRCSQTIYKKAESASESGDYSQAVMLFVSLGDYEDASDRAYQAAYAMTGDRNTAEDMIASGGLTPEEFERSILIAQKRSAIPQRTIAAGSYHTVVLRQDGTVAACGDNSSGQCDVSGWKNVVQVFAGAKHTVGLRSDGTAVAVGDNSFGQCDVSEWKDIIQLAVNDYNTIALLSDGTVVSCGYNTYDTIQRASGVSEIYAGCYAAVAVTESGTCISSHKAYALQPEGAVMDISMNTGYSAVLYSDGTCRFSIDMGEEWENIICVDAGSTAVIGVDVDGNIRSHFFRSPDSISFTSDMAMQQCAAGTEHFVFLTFDGQVAAFGDNSYGQCDVGGLR